MRYLEERGIGFDVGVTKVPLVCQSDLFDLTVADARTRPDAAMAYAACVNAETGNYRERQPRRGHRCDCRQAAGHGPLHEIRHRQLRRAGGRPEVGALVAVVRHARGLAQPRLVELCIGEKDAKCRVADEFFLRRVELLHQHPLEIQKRFAVVSPQPGDLAARLKIIDIAPPR